MVTTYRDPSGSVYFPSSSKTRVEVSLVVLFNSGDWVCGDSFNHSLRLFIFEGQPSHFFQHRLVLSPTKEVEMHCPRLGHGGFFLP